MAYRIYIMNTKKCGNVFIVSAASGTGKTTLVSRLLECCPDVRVSISHTTRQPRVGEVDGQHYYFVSKEAFVALAGQGAFLEHAEVFGHYYGTDAANVQALCAKGFDVILEIDVQGAEQVRRALPDAIGIFILPPSLAVLKQRLCQRQTDSEEVINRRLAEAELEIQHAFSFDYVVVNDDLNVALQALQMIISASRYRIAQQAGVIEQVLSKR